MRPKGTAAELEARRHRAIDLFQEGKSITEVSRLVAADVSSVKRWKRAFTQGGRQALAAKPNRGRPSRLTPAQKQQLAEIVRAGPLAAGFRTDLWSCRRVALVIQKQFGVKYHPDHVGRLLHALGFTQQKPQRRARQRDEVAIQAWRNEVWPQLKKRGVASKPASCSSMKQDFSCSR